MEPKRAKQHSDNHDGNITIVTRRDDNGAAEGNGDAGIYCATNMDILERQAGADSGADVVDVESPPHGDIQNHQTDYCSSPQISIVDIPRDHGTGSVLNRNTFTRDRARSKNFLKSIRKKNIDAVKETLENFNGPEVKLYLYTDENGVSAIESAVQSGSIDMVQLLLSSAKESEKRCIIKHAMLFAIKEDNFELLQFLVTESNELRRNSIVSLPFHEQNDDTEERPTAIKLEKDIPAGGPNTFPRRMKDKMKRAITNSTGRAASSMAVELEDAEYSNDVTPIVLAAQLERREMIEYLTSTTTRLDIHPVTERCGHEADCYLCREKKEFVGRRSIAECRKMIEVFKALSSPAYMIVTSAEDPILEAFLLSELMHKRSDEDAAFRSEYGEIEESCRQFSRDFLSECRNSEEVETLINRRVGLEVTNAKGRKAKFPRIHLAMHYTQKEFIAHPFCQQLLQQEWHKGIPDWVCWSHLHNLRVLLFFFIWGLLSPLIFLTYILRIDILNLEKINKSGWGRFLNDMMSYFWFLVLVVAACSTGSNDNRMLSIQEWILLPWVAGLTLRFFKIAYYRRAQIKHIFGCNANFNWLTHELLFIIFFWVYYIIRWSSSHEKSENRMDWKGDEPYLISEVFFGIAATLSVLQIIGYFKVNSHLGPLQITLKRMIWDVVRFLFLILVVLSAFAVGIAYIYRGYHDKTISCDATPWKDGQCEGGKIDVNVALVSVHDAYLTLFWNAFGYGEEEDTRLIMEDPRKHQFTESVGMIMSATYHVIVIIILANMLIAMVSNAYSFIQEHADMEWKFALTQFRMSYLNEHPVLPPPANLLPFRKIIKYCKPGRGLKKKQKALECQTMLREHDIKYMVLIDKLCKRYWKKHMQKKGQDSESTDHRVTRIFESAINTSEA